VAADQPSAPRRSVLGVDLRDAFAMAEYLLEVHGLDDWEVSYDNAKRRAGICHFADRTLGLSAPLTAIHGEDDVRDTILHEIAHALVGPAHGHDATWREMARRIGSSGERCVSPDLPTPPAAWLGTCPGGHTIERHRRPERVLTCGLCSSVFDLAHIYTWTHHGRPAVMPPKYAAELARLGVASMAHVR
jgi:predicted SprT family Zn-dependent metalloprotease